MNGNVVITNFMEGDFARGCIENAKIYPMIDEDGVIKIKKEDNSKYFRLSFPAKEVSALNVNSISEAIEVAKKLLNVGFKVETIVFNEKVYDLTGQEKIITM